jgi:hypothetical protein
MKSKPSAVAHRGSISKQGNVPFGMHNIAGSLIHKSFYGGKVTIRALKGACLVHGEQVD